MAFPSTGLVVTIEAAFGADRNAAPATWVWTDLTDRWHIPDGLSIFEGRREGARQAEAGEISFTWKNVDGQLTPEDPRSQWWPHVDEGLPVRVTLDPELPGEETLVFGGFVASLTPVWPGGSAKQALVQVTVGGVIRQHARGQSPVQPVLDQYLPATNPFACWPLDEGVDATVGRALAGDAPLVPFTNPDPQITPPKWSQGTLAPHLPPTLRMATDPEMIGTTLVATFGRVLGGVSPLGEWTMDWLHRYQDGASLSIIQVGGNPEIQNFGVSVRLAPTPATPGQRVRVSWFDFDLQTTVDAENSATQVPFDSRMHHFRLAISQDGSDSDYTLFMDGEPVITGTAPRLITPHSILLQAGLTIAEQGATATHDVGWLAMWDTPPLLAEAVNVAFGRVGEAAGRRAQRLCAEQDVTLTVIGDLDDTQPMGAQQPGTLLGHLREVEATDDGILSEQAFGFLLRTGRSRYNQTPALIVDAAARQLGQQFVPVRDDQRVRNRWTVTQAGPGTQPSATADDLADQSKRGLRDDSLTVNIASPTGLAGRAAWELSRSTVTGLRYPTLTVHLHSSPALLAQVMATRLGNRVQVVNPPVQHPPGLVDQVVEGIGHTISGRRRWTWQAVVAPAAPWTVGVWADTSETPDPDAPSRYDTAGSQTTAGVFQAGTGTELTVETTLGPLWTTAAADLPLDIRAAGVQLRVTDVAPTALDTFTRVVADGWGTTDTGQVWALSGTAANFDVNGSVGTIADPAAAGSQATLGDHADVELLCRVAASALIGDVGMVARWQDAGNSYFFGLDLSVAGTPPSIDIWVRVAGVGTLLVSVPFAFTIGTFYWMRARCRGSELLLRVWPDGTPEPGGWTVGATDATYSSGAVGCAQFAAGGVVASWDDFQVVNPQIMTVQQAPVNGVVKAIPDGSPLSLWTPARYAL